MLTTATILSAQAPKIVFEHYSTADGLPGNRVGFIFQDQQGYIWFNTQAGLVKYDGYEFKTFLTQGKDSTGLNLRNSNGDLVERKDGRIWIGGVVHGGLALFDPKTETFRNFLPDPLDSFAIPYYSAFPFLEDSRQNLWIVFFDDQNTRNTYLGRLDQKTKRFYTYPYAISRIKVNDVVLNLQFAESKLDSSIWLIDRSKRKLLKWNESKDQFEPPTSASGNIVNKDSIIFLVQTKDGRFFLGGPTSKKLYLWNPATEKLDTVFEYHPDATYSLPDEAVGYGFEDDLGHYWVIHPGTNYLSRINPGSGKISTYTFGEGSLAGIEPFPNGAFKIMLANNKKGLWFQTAPARNYLFFDYATESFQVFNRHFNHPEQILPNQITAGRFLMDHSGLIWMGFSNGLYRQAPKKQQIRHYTSQANDPTSLPSNNITCLYEDSRGQFWIGTDQGLAKYLPGQDQFVVYNQEQGRLSHNTIANRGIIEDSKGDLWIATLNGLNHWSATHNTFRSFLVGVEKDNNIQALIEDRNGQLWISINQRGVVIFDKNAKKIVQEFSAEENGLACKTITSILQDSRGTIWLGDGAENEFGAFRYDADTKQFHSYVRIPGDTTSLRDNEVRLIFEDSRQNLWFGTDGGGVAQYLPETDGFISYYDPFEFQSPLGVAEDQEGRLWFSTTVSNNGLGMIDPERKTLRLFNTTHGLPHNQIPFYSEIIPIDPSGRLYLPTLGGLSVFDPNTEQFSNYYEYNGFQKYLGNYQGLMTQDGSIWIGGDDGLNRIDPNRLVAKDTTPPIVHITKMGILDQTYSLYQDRLVPIPGGKKQSLRLSHQQKDLRFEFVGLHYLDPPSNQYSWRLDNYDEADIWTTPSSNREVNYTNLSPGTYTFQVRASNADGIWNNAGAALTFTILPAWWQTKVAYLAYLLLVLAGIYGVINWRTRALQRQRELLRQRVHEQTKELKTAYQEANQAKEAAQAAAKIAEEANEAKSNFLNTVSHELRTPLTSIIGFTKLNKKNLEEKVLPEISDNGTNLQKTVQRVTQNLDIVESEGERLTHLINDLLDLAKIESGKVDWHIQEVHPRELIERATVATDALFTQKPSINLTQEIPEQLPMIAADRDRIIQVLINLISNAVKFTEEGAIVVGASLPSPASAKATPGKASLLFYVQDSGSGIPSDQLENIFEKFKQVENNQEGKPKGTGLGLPICKEIVEHHGGKIWADSELGVGSTFYFTLPGASVLSQK